MTTLGATLSDTELTAGAPPPSGTGWRHVTAGVEDAAASTPTAADVGALAVGGTAADVNVSGTAIAAALAGKLGTSAQAADVNPAGTSIAAALSGKAATAQTMFIGTTSHAINRGSASEALTGITSIDGSAATLTTGRNIGGRSFNGSADIVSPTWKCGQGTRDISTASGAQNIAHGLGRVPSYVHMRFQMVFSATVSMECNAHYDGTSQSGQCIIWTEGTTTAVTDNIYQSTAAAVGLCNAGGVNPFTGATKASAVITVDATNIILTWTKTGSPTGTANVAWEVT